MSRRENGKAVKKRPQLVVSGETPQNNTLALREGFEPPVHWRGRQQATLA